MYFIFLQTGDYIFLEVDVKEVPDRFSIDGGDNFLNATVGGLDPNTAKNGDWEWDNVNKKVKFISRFVLNIFREIFLWKYCSNIIAI